MISGRCPATSGAATGASVPRPWYLPVARARGALLQLLPGLLPLLAGCVATVVADDPMQPAVAAQPIVIDLPTDASLGDDRVVRQFYESVLARLQAAHQDRDLDTMRALIATYLRDEAPEWGRQRLLGFRALAAGLQFERHAAQHAAIVTRVGDGDASGDPDSIGTPLQFELSLPPPPDGMVWLGGRGDDDPVAFRVEVRVRDHFVDGSCRDHSDGDIVRLDRAVALGSTPLCLPIRMDLGGGDAVRRETDVRIDLLPGYVRVGEDRAPVRRTVLAATTRTQWPPGHQAIRAAPWTTLRAAMQQGDAAHYKHVRLAAEFAPSSDRPAIEAALIDWVRLGTEDQAVVAMASLRAIGAAQNAIGDRDAWLAWWQRRWSDGSGGDRRTP